ncbi:MFS transporter [Phenylobacterium sp.]|jgi:DHA2 family multidrug resistance protein|uniref:MFS transporter n=1 Tax=Phenylobacterium sp. TaxID=1871053 RepID=UPI002E363174|nr:MFS transporter [Phenylobacterium sp.]HEX4712523.1 MFS transporter [Phenylobacterium sp.]
MSLPATPPAGAAPTPPAEQPIPWFGLAAVLLGTFISTLNGRLSAFGLGDIRGGVHAGFDDGAWITTAQTVAQMLILPIAVWLGAVFGARRVLIQAALAYAVISFLEPFSPNLATLLGLQFMGGLASGFFIPLTLSFILRGTPPRFWAYGIALYALNLELSLNISASLEGWYVDNLSWRWIFWQNVPLALGMFACFRWGSRPEPPNPAPPMPDRFGLVTSGAGLALIYAALDQGNRLDWLNSGLIVGLLVAGVILVAAFVVHERRSHQAFINLKVAVSPPMPRLLAGVAFLRLTILSTAYLIPQFLGAVRGFRALEVGQTMIWIAAPQLIVCPLAAVMLRRMDPRLVASMGFILICIACLMVAYGLTPVWGSDQFLLSQLLQAVGQSLALSGVVFFGILHMKPEDALTFGAALQTSRLMGGQIGSAFIATFVRVRSQIASNHIGLHVQVGDSQVLHRLHTYAEITGQAVDPATASERAVAVLAGVVRSAAATQGVIDGFVAIGVLTAVALMVVVVAQKPAPIGPASHTPLFGPRPEPTPTPDVGAQPS